MFAEQYSLLIVNAISLLAWTIDIVAFCSTTKKNNLIFRGVIKLLKIIIYGLTALWYPCMTEWAICFIFLYNAFSKFYSLIFTLIISIALVIWNVSKIGNIDNINVDNIIPITSFSISIIGVVFCKSVHSIRITKGLAALLYLYYDTKHVLIFAASQDLFIVLLMVADVLIGKFDKESKSLSN